MARILQKTRSSNRGEQRMLQLLAGLPDEWYVLCELRIHVNSQGRASPSRERRPDFVVLAPEVGFVSIETKDWNLDRNRYTWLDQHWIRKDPAGEMIENPWHQAFEYEKEFQRLIGNRSLWVTSIVAFPLLDRARFWNQLGDQHTLELNPQSRMMVDLRKTLFRDDIGNSRAGLRDALQRVVSLDERFHPSDPRAVREALDKLIPSEFRVGDSSERRAEDRNKLRILTNRQQSLAFRLPIGRHLLFDLPGSGKTNILVSRAIHLAKTQTHSDGPYRVLILTYNIKLARAIKTMLDDKLNGEDLAAARLIEILDLETAVRNLLAVAFDVEGDEITQMIPFDLSPAERLATLEATLRDYGSTLGGRCRVYDAVLVDEVQDFSKLTDQVVKLVLKGQELFLTGDVGQRLHDQVLQVAPLGVDIERHQLNAEYVMYRCPAAIAEWAYLFARDDGLLRAEFENYGYGDSVTFGRKVLTLPQAHSVETDIEEGDVIREVILQHVGDGIALRDIMVVTSPRRVPRVLDLLARAGILAKESPTSGDGVLVVSFIDSKGLEAEVVILTGVEDLLVRQSAPSFAKTGVSAQAESLNRRQVYVAITRTTGYLDWVYQDDSHGIVSDLLRHYRRIVQKVTL